MVRIATRWNVIIGARDDRVTLHLASKITYLSMDIISICLLFSLCFVQLTGFYKFIVGIQTFLKKGQVHIACQATSKSNVGRCFI